MKMKVDLENIKMIGLRKGFVILKEYSEDWKKEYLIEEKELKGSISHIALDIQHIGSTSIPGCIAKPIIDIAIAIEDFDDGYRIREALNKSYYFYKGDAGIPGRHFFVKGSEELRTHYIHVLLRKSQEWENHLLFRDFLTKNPDYIIEYCSLKKSLFINFSNNREEYTKRKDPFIRKILSKAREEMHKKCY